MTDTNKIEYSVFPGVQISLDKSELADYLVERSNKLHALLLVMSAADFESADSGTQSGCIELAESICAEVKELAVHVPMDQSATLAEKKLIVETVAPTLALAKAPMHDHHPEATVVLKQFSQQP